MSGKNGESSTMSTRIPGFRGEYFWEFDLAEKQLLQLAECFPAERYAWRPAETARSVSEVLVHLGMGGRAMLVLLGVEAAPDLYGALEGEGAARIMAMIKENEGMEKNITDKAAVLSLLRKSLGAVRRAFAEAPDPELDRPEVFFGERTTVRRLYLRGLCHMHEHMGQLTAYARAMGMPVPWKAEHEALRKDIEDQMAASKE